MTFGVLFRRSISVCIGSKNVLNTIKKNQSSYRQSPEDGFYKKSHNTLRVLLTAAIIGPPCCAQAVSILLLCDIFLYSLPYKENYVTRKTMKGYGIMHRITACNCVNSRNPHIMVAVNKISAFSAFRL